MNALSRLSHIVLFIVLLTGICHGQQPPSGLSELVMNLLTLANRGDATAQDSLGFAYQTGQGAPEDITEAVTWYRKASTQGNAGAQYHLGWCYRYGRGLPTNLIEAVVWFRNAAEQGQVWAQVNLGEMYSNGEGVPKDEAEAGKWYERAANQGNANVQKWMGKLAERGDLLARQAIEKTERGNRLAQHAIDMMIADRKINPPSSRNNSPAPLVDPFAPEAPQTSADKAHAAMIAELVTNTEHKDVAEIEKSPVFWVWLGKQSAQMQDLCASGGVQGVSYVLSAFKKAGYRAVPVLDAFGLPAEDAFGIPIPGEYKLVAEQSAVPRDNPANEGRTIPDAPKTLTDADFVNSDAKPPPQQKTAHDSDAMVSLLVLGVLVGLVIFFRKKRNEDPLATYSASPPSPHVATTQRKYNDAASGLLTAVWAFIPCGVLVATGIMAQEYIVWVLGACVVIGWGISKYSQRESSKRTMPPQPLLDIPIAGTILGVAEDNLGQSHISSSPPPATVSGSPPAIKPPVGRGLPPILRWVIFWIFVVIAVVVHAAWRAATRGYSFGFWGGFIPAFLMCLCIGVLWGWAKKTPPNQQGETSCNKEEKPKMDPVKKGVLTGAIVFAIMLAALWPTVDTRMKFVGGDRRFIPVEYVHVGLGGDGPLCVSYVFGYALLSSVFGLVVWAWSGRKRND